MLLAMLPARLLVPKALPARLEAWLNLSQREKARVFIMVRTRAMTVGDLLAFLASHVILIDLLSLCLCALFRSRRWEDDRYSAKDKVLQGMTLPGGGGEITY